MRSLGLLCSWVSAHIFLCTRRRGILVLVFLALLVLSFRWGIICVNIQPHLHINKICTNYSKGLTVGNLCEALCHSEVSSVTCQTFHFGKEAVFSGVWGNNAKEKQLIFKVLRTPMSSIEQNLTDNEFYDMISKNIEVNFHLLLNREDVKKFVSLRNHGWRRKVEMANILTLFQENEYVALILYADLDVFPELVGTCGSLFAVEKLNLISSYSSTWRETSLNANKWKNPIKIALLILKLLSDLDYIEEPLYICDVKTSHFGVTDDFTAVKYLDLDFVHPTSIVNQIVRNGAPCTKHSDCDYFDCRSLCNFVSGKCTFGVTNNNLQMVCERVFLGWLVKGKIMVPGLLLGPDTPPSLVGLLETCANPSSELDVPRSAASKDIHNKLVSLLVQMDTP